MTASLIRAAIERRYPWPEYAVFHEVPNDAGFNVSGYADTIVVSLWPSRGLEIMGFEIKSYRGDWQRELVKPGKAEKHARFCDRWSVATMPGIIAEGELPATWGHVELAGARLVEKVPAPKLPAQDLTRGFFTALVKASRKDLETRVQQQAREIADRLDQGRKETFEERVKARTGEAEQWMRRFEKLTAAMDANSVPQWLDDDEFISAFCVAARCRVGGYQSIDTIERMLAEQLSHVRKVRADIGLPKLEKVKRR